MYFVKAIFVALITVSECSECDVTAPLPKDNPPIDLHKFKGTWYETVTSMDHISMNHACVMLSNLHWTRNGHKGAVTYYFDNGQELSFEMHIRNTKDGYFKQELVEKMEDIAEGRDEFGKMDPQAKADSSELHQEKFALIGDADQYVAHIRCTPAGWTIWALTREKTVTPEQLVFIHNDLLKHGISAPLQLGRCQNVIDK